MKTECVLPVKPIPGSWELSVLPKLKVGTAKKRNVKKMRPTNEQLADIVVEKLLC